MFSTRPEAIHVPSERLRKLLIKPAEILLVQPGISDERIREAEEVAVAYHFRVPEYYIRHVLDGRPNDPLVDIILPSSDELLDGDEQWDATPSRYRVSRSTFWVQKYEYQGLIRTTTFCSGLCRFCYLKKKNAAAIVMRPADVDFLFDDIEKGGEGLREIILSGGDPLCAPVETLDRIAKRVRRLREAWGRAAPHIVIHTREPVWDPVRLLHKHSLWTALDAIKPKAVMINVLHPREVTGEFLEVCRRLADVGVPHSRPALFCQHPLFRGVNDSVELLSLLYGRLIEANPPILPYYLVHPFYNGTLCRHYLRLEESQRILSELVRGPGWFAPRLVVPTPWGKCVIGPHQHLVRNNDGYELTTKDGKRIFYDDASIPPTVRLLD